MTEYIYTAHMPDGNEIRIPSSLDYDDFITRLGSLRIRNSQSLCINENPFALNVDMEIGPESIIDQEVDYDKIQIVNLDQICYFTIQRVR